MPKKVPHIAFITQEALFHPDFIQAATGHSPIVEIPPGFINGPFVISWIHIKGIPVAVFRFEVWEAA